MTATPWTKHDASQPEAPTGRRAGWADHVGRPRHAGIGTRADVERHAAELDRHDDESGERSGTGTAQRHAVSIGKDDRHGTGTAPARHSGTADRHDFRADADVPTHHEIVVPDRHADAGRDDDRAGAALAARAAEAARSSVDHLRFGYKPLGSLKDLLLFARHAHYNLSHLDSVRSVHVAFFFWVTAPVLIIVWPLLWTFALRLHRALTAWLLVLICAPFLNPVADWLVWDGFDMTMWSTTTKQWVGGVLFAFVLSAVAIYVRNARRR